MHYRYMTSKTFDSGVVTGTSTLNGTPIYTTILSKYGKVSEKEYKIELTKGLPEKVNFNSTVSIFKDYVDSNKLLRHIMISLDGDEIIPLVQQFDFKVGQSFNSYHLNKELESEFSNGKTLWDLLNDIGYSSALEHIALDMFPLSNPLTGQPDVTPNAFYTSYIPLVSLTGVIPPQLSKDNLSYFNPNGTVTVAEFIDSLNAIKYGSNSNLSRKKSLDSIASEDDFFNEGYNSCLRELSSPFYRLYSRRELDSPITRLELAYIVVVCWYDFISKFEHINGGKNALGVNLDWTNPCRYVGKFNDGISYNVCQKLIELDYEETSIEGSVVSIDIHDYKSNLSMSEYINKMKSGAKAIPLPMFMCLFELDALDLFYFEGNNLSPLKEVSRGEWCYFITKLAKEFSSKFISSGDNSY